MNNVKDLTTGWKQGDFVIVVYDKRCYIGQVTDKNKDDDKVEVNCMEECCKVECRFKLPKMRITYG